ncbi:MAG: hypothetical protein LCH78_20535 [Proteobacteria bacterium]|nr:hypothetical protein [Pseudomonadota bacterium]
MTTTAMSKSLTGQRHGGVLKLHRDCGFGEVSNPPRLARTSTVVGPCLASASSAPSYLTIGGGAHSAGGGGQGGARNRADRDSYALTVAQVANLIAAERYAQAIGLPFTRMVTIHWQAAGVPLAGMAKATGRFLDLMSKALARHGSPTAWIWTHESATAKGQDKGGHCHMLAHVPAPLVAVVANLQRGWLRRITGQPYRARVILSKPIGGRLGLETGNPQLHAVNLQVAFGYLLKGASQEAAAQFGLERLEPGGRVIGKRCGTSQNIGAKARNAQVQA